MTDRHIDFSVWEPGEALDQEHLEACEQCREAWKADQFIRLQARQAPRLEPPPFFASRVIYRARETSAPLLLMIQRMAQRLVLVLSLLVIVTSFLVYKEAGGSENGSSVTQSNSSNSVYSQILFEEPTEETINVDFVVNSLSQTPEEGFAVEKPR